jgi:hypothetical protein
MLWQLGMETLAGLTDYILLDTSRRVRQCPPDHGRCRQEVRWLGEIELLRYELAQSALLWASLVVQRPHTKRDTPRPLQPVLLPFSLPPCCSRSTFSRVISKFADSSLTMFSLNRSASSSCSVSSSRHEEQSPCSSPLVGRLSSASHSPTAFVPQIDFASAPSLALPSRIPKPSPVKRYAFVHARVLHLSLNGGHIDMVSSALPLPVHCVRKQRTIRVKVPVIDGESVIKVPAWIRNVSLAAPAKIVGTRSLIRRPCNFRSSVAHAVKCTLSVPARTKRLADGTRSCSGSGISVKVGSRVPVLAMKFTSDVSLAKAHSTAKPVLAATHPSVAKQRSGRVVGPAWGHEHPDVIPHAVRKPYSVACAGPVSISTTKVSKKKENESKRSVGTTLRIFSLNSKVLFNYEASNRAYKFEGILVSSDVEVRKVLGEITLSGRLMDSICKGATQRTVNTQELGKTKEMLDEAMMAVSSAVVCRSVSKTNTTQVSGIFGTGIGGEA